MAAKNRARNNIWDGDKGPAVTTGLMWDGKNQDLGGCCFQLEVAVSRGSPPCFHVLICCQHEGGLKYLRDVLPSTSQLISFITSSGKNRDI